LERALALLEEGCPLDLDAGRQQPGEVGRQRGDVDCCCLRPVVVEDHVEILARDSQPVGRASPKLSWGRGENPSV